MKRPGIAVINYGGQLAPQIGKPIRQAGVWTEMLMPYEQRKLLREGCFDNAFGIIHSGSRCSVYDKNAPLPDREILELDIPQLGLCYGQQAIHYVLGGEISKGESGEFGVSTLHIKDHSDIFRGLGSEENVLMNHRDRVERPAPGHESIGYTIKSPNAATRNSKKKIFGVQFHPEAYQTPRGAEMMSNFLDICGCRRDWNPADSLQEKKEMIKREAGNSPVVVLSSFGKDSTTAALIAKQVLDPKQAFYLHVSTGLEREDEVSNGIKMFKEIGITNIHVFDASDMIFQRLKGVWKPNEKRVIVGDSIYDAADELAIRLGLPRNYKIMQGTLCTDKVESSAVTGLEDQIKIHHNVTPRSAELRKQGRMIEPLDDYYKDDCKKLAVIVGTPQKVTDDEPMPGPGLSIRILCLPENFTFDRREIDELDRQARSISTKYSLNAHTRPYTTVGVQGDARTEVHPALIEGSMDESIFKEFSKDLTDSVKGISRVWYLLKPEKAKSIEVMRGRYVTRDRAERLRDFEHVTKDVMRNNKSKVGKITQFPMFLIPDSVNSGNETVVLRPFTSLDYMTGESVFLPRNVTDDIVNAIDKSNKKMGYDEVAVAIEGEGKPPGTTELE